MDSATAARTRADGTERVELPDLRLTISNVARTGLLHDVLHEGHLPAVVSDLTHSS
jgi:hypothetical protein